MEHGLAFPQVGHASVGGKVAVHMGGDIFGGELTRVHAQLFELFAQEFFHACGDLKVGARSLFVGSRHTFLVWKKWRQGLCPER